MQIHSVLSRVIQTRTTILHYTAIILNVPAHDHLDVPVFERPYQTNSQCCTFTLSHCTQLVTVVDFVCNRASLVQSWPSGCMESFSVYRLLTRKGLKRDDLNHRTKKEHRDRIAIKLGSDWKSCAEVLGLSEREVEIITRENKWSRNRRLAMLHKWEADNEEATYMRLVQALAAVGRDDLAVNLVDMFISEQGYLFRRLGKD